MSTGNNIDALEAKLRETTGDPTGAFDLDRLEDANGVAMGLIFNFIYTDPNAKSENPRKSIKPIVARFDPFTGEPLGTVLAERKGKSE